MDLVLWNLNRKKDFENTCFSFSQFIIHYGNFSTNQTENTVFFGQLPVGWIFLFSVKLFQTG
jgi:hypothetical protein